MTTLSVMTGKDNVIFITLFKLPLGVTTEPNTFTVTPTADITSGSTSFTLTTPLAVGENIGKGHPILFDPVDSSKFIIPTEDYVGNDAITTINHQAANSTITAGPGSVGPIRCLGGTSTGTNQTTATIDSLVFETVGAYLSKALVSKDLTLPFTGNWLPDYPITWLLTEIENDASHVVWYELQAPKPAWAAKGKTTKGIGFLSDINTNFPVDAALESTFTIQANGTPVNTQPSAT